MAGFAIELSVSAFAADWVLIKEHDKLVDSVPREARSYADTQQDETLTFGGLFATKQEQ